MPHTKQHKPPVHTRQARRRVDLDSQFDTARLRAAIAEVATFYRRLNRETRGMQIARERLVARSPTLAAGETLFALLKGFHR